MPAPEAAVQEWSRLLRTAQAEQRLPSVSAAVVRGSEVVWREAVGLADVEERSEAAPDTQYRVGSVTKTFTAAAILQLRDAGALAVDDRLNRHIREAPHGGATIRRLLSHLSGLQREVPGDVWETMSFPERSELMAVFAQAEQVLGPGEHWHYSNLAFAVLGEVVSRASGVGYERYVSERLIGPAGLSRTTWEPEPPFAQGYLVGPHDDSVRREPLVDLRAKRPSGQLWSTTEDLCRWVAFLASPDPTVLRRETAEEMRAFQGLSDHERWTAGYGLGLALYRDGDRILFGHSGGMPGFITQVAYSARDKVGAAAVTNSTTAPRLRELCFALIANAAEALPPEPAAWRPADAVPDDIAPLLGSWWFEGYELVFRYRDGRLEARGRQDPPDAPPAVFASDGGDRFRVVSGPERGELLRVVRDEEGVPRKLYWATYPYTREPRVFGT